MSDLQDLIAKNAVMAYNQGFERGEASERERIIKILTTSQCEDCTHPGECITFIANVQRYVELIEGKQG